MGKERDIDQSWFWTEAWQAAEAEADKDIEEGRVIEFENVDDAIAYLHGEALPASNSSRLLIMLRADAARLLSSLERPSSGGC